MRKKPASGVIETREAYLVKRRSFPDSDVSRFTNDEDSLFEHPARVPCPCPRRVGHRSSAVPKWFSRRLQEPPREKCGLYGRLLFAVKCFLHGGLNNTFIFFADHDDGRSWTRWVRPVIGELASILLVFKTHGISPT